MAAGRGEEVDEVHRISGSPHVVLSRPDVHSAESAATIAARREATEYGPSGGVQEVEVGDLIRRTGGAS